VIGIDASAKLEETRDQVARIAKATAELIGVARPLRDDEITILAGWAGDLYGIPKHATVLYAHLGGQPALNTYSSLFTHTHPLTV
jgi:1-aminocyclopropane-1-carboxylate deaminase